MQNELDNTDNIEALRRLALDAWKRAEALQQQADALAREKVLLLDKTDALQSNNKLLTAKNRSLEDELSVLLQRIAELTRALAAATNKDQQQQLKLELRELQQRLSAQATELYGESSERRTKTKEETQKTKAKNTQKGHGPTKQPNLPIVPVVHTLDDADCMCPKCGGNLRQMNGQFEESELIVAVKRTFFIQNNQRQKYHCCDCEHIETALGPTKLIFGGRYDLSFVVQVAIDKYLDARAPRRRAQQPKGKKERVMLYG